MMKNLSILAIFLMLAVITAGCGEQNIESVYGTESSSVRNDSNSAASIIDSDADSSATSETSVGTDTRDIFSNRDFEVGYEESESALIKLNGDTAFCSSDAVEISGSTITITDERTYIVSGTLDDGMIIIDTDKSDKVQLVLDTVTIHSETCAPIYILQADKVFITMASGSTNTLSNGGTFTAIDENAIDAVIFSKEDLTLNGSGTLRITSPAGHGIVSKDSLRITSGSYDINCASHALSGKDEVCIANADFTMVSGKDGIHADNEDDASLGYVYIQSGTFSIDAEGDGISASSWLQIEDGSFDITAGGGSINAASASSDSWGNFKGGGRHGGGQMNGFTGNSSGTSAAETDSTDSTSMKGIKASDSLTINGGTFAIDSADDSLHSNASLAVNGGTFEIASGDDAFHADDTLTVTAGTINISESYEGLEGLHVVISGGDIALVASDDGLNAAGGTDSSGSGGRDGMFGGPGSSSSSNGTILISGGTIAITAYGDGIDANGTLEITGGYITVCGPTQGDTATLDYDVSGTISGGTFIGTGASGMAQTFSSSKQGVISINAGTQSAGTQIQLSDSEGNTVITYVPALDFSVVILSSPAIISGETYTVTVGSSSNTFTAS